MLQNHRAVEGLLLVVIAVLALIVLFGGSTAAGQEPPQLVRHDRAQAGTEFLVLRHQRLVPGSHQRFYELSRAGVWPFFEKIGSRVVGQWLVVEPGQAQNPEREQDEGFRLARYRGYDHWRATRQMAELGGNGNDYETNREALATRRKLLLGSDGAVYLEGPMAPGGPYFQPALGSSFATGDSSDSSDTGATSLGPDPQLVRHDVARPGQEIVTLRYFKIRAGSFDEFYRLSRDQVWPYFEKMGARVLGQWRIVHPGTDAGPEASLSTASQDRVSENRASENRASQGTGTSAEEPYDEALMMVRYASHEHWAATRPDIMATLGGDGNDYRLCLDGLERRRVLTLETNVRFLQGYLYQSPPVYLPAME